MKKWLVLTLFCFACGDDSQPGPTFQSTCTPTEASAEAKIPAGPYAGHAGSYVLIDGRVLSPAGTQDMVGGFPLAMRWVGTGTRFLAITDGAEATESIRIFDTQSGQVVASEPYNNPHGLFYGLAVSPNGQTLYAAGGGENVVHVLGVTSSGALTAQPDIAVPSFPAGMAISADGATLYVIEQETGKLAVVNTATHLVTTELVAGASSEIPFDVALSPTRNEAYVTMTANKSLVVVDLAAGMAAARISVGKNPEGLVVTADGKYALVGASDDDSLAVIDLTARTLAKTVPLGLEPQLKGASPSALALSPDGSKLYAALAAENSLVEISTADWMPIGRLPTGWYPQAVAVASDGSVYVANAKGVPAGAASAQIDKQALIQGTMTVLTPAPADAAFQAGTATVMANNARPTPLAAQPTCEPGKASRFPLPLAMGDPTPIQHVILIVRENKTYDAELGSLTGANGDGSLEIFGPTMTPNLHQLAKDFVNGDNFYIASEASLQGHVLTTAAFVNDFGEKAWLQTWGRGWRNMVTYSQNIVAPDGFIWQKLKDANISYVDMGEIVGTTDSTSPVNLDSDYPGLVFDLDTTDSARAAYFGRYLAKTATLPRFIYMILPRNHTYGMAAGKEAPESMIADNDEATGSVIDLLSHSKFWASSIVFVVEDDPSDGGDHIDGHRSICLVASPWVRRNYTTSAHYDIGSVFHTIELLLGIPPLYQADARSPAMYDIFSATPNTAPWTHIPRMIPETTNPSDDPLAVESATIDFSEPDKDAGKLSRILWKHFKGTEPPWQEAADDD
jgi:DNA-binding beta-propeller fold protein YncE